MKDLLDWMLAIGFCVLPFLYMGPLGLLFVPPIFCLVIIMLY
jgi:hypothetical protein